MPRGAMQGMQLDTHAGLATTVNRTEASRRKKSNEAAHLCISQTTYRTIALALLVAVMGLTAAVVWLATSGILVVPPGVLKVDVHGQEELLSSMPTKPLNVEQSVTHDLILAWIESVREIPDDQRLFGRNWDKVQLYTTTVGLRRLEAYRRDQWARLLKGLRVNVVVGRVQPIQGESNAWTGAWCEETHAPTGQLLRDDSGLWTATLRIADWQSKVAKEALDLLRHKKIFRNLYGVFIHGIAWEERPLPGDWPQCKAPTAS